MAVPGGGGYASPFSELTLDNLHAKGFDELLNKGILKYIRSGTRTRREGVLYAGVNYLNQFIHSPWLYRALNKKSIFSQLHKPFIKAVAVHHDTTPRMLFSFIRAMSDNQSVCFCFHGILRSNEKGYDNRFNWDYDRFEELLNYLSSDKRINTLKTMDLVYPPL